MILTSKEEYIYNNLIKELNRPIELVKDNIDSKADVYFFLKEYCLENLILLSVKQREKFIKLICKEVGIWTKTKK